MKAWRSINWTIKYLRAALLQVHGKRHEHSRKLPENSPITCTTLGPTFTKFVTSEGIWGPASCVTQATKICEDFLSCSRVCTEEANKNAHRSFREKIEYKKQPYQIASRDPLFHLLPVHQEAAAKTNHRSDNSEQTSSYLYPTQKRIRWKDVKRQGQPLQTNSTIRYHM